MKYDISNLLGLKGKWYLEHLVDYKGNHTIAIYRDKVSLCRVFRYGNLSFFSMSECKSFIDSQEV